MPISDRLRAGGLAALALLLSACLPQVDMAGNGVESVKVADRQITIAGPPGYCIDTQSSRDRASGSVVLLGSCATLVRDGASGPASPAVLTALVAPAQTPPVLPSARQVETFFRSDAGRRALAHDGRASSVTLLSISRRDEVVYLNMRDRSADRPDGLTQTIWRAVLPLGDRMVALSVKGHAERPIGAAEAKRTLERFVTAMQAANSPSAVVDTAAVAHRDG